MLGRRQQQLLLLERSGGGGGGRRGGGRGGAGEVAGGERDGAAAAAVSGSGGVLLSRMRHAAAAAVGRGAAGGWGGSSREQQQQEKEFFQHQDSIKRRELTFDEDAWARHGSVDFAAIKLRHMQESEGTTQVSGDDYGELHLESEEDETAAAAAEEEEEREVLEEEEGDIGEEQEEHEERDGVDTYAQLDRRRLRRGEEEEEEGTTYQGQGRKQWYHPSPVVGRRGQATASQMITTVEEDEGEEEEAAEAAAEAEEEVEEEEYEREEEEEEEEEEPEAAVYTEEEEEEQGGEEEGEVEEGEVETAEGDGVNASIRRKHVATDEGEDIAADDDAWRVEQQPEEEEEDVEVELSDRGEGVEEGEGAIAEEEAQEEVEQEEGHVGAEEEEEGAVVEEQEEGFYAEEAEEGGENAVEAEEGEVKEVGSEGAEKEEDEEEEDLTPYSLPQIESLVEVRHVPGKGRCLYTRNTLEPGAIIFVESPVFVATPSANTELWQVLEQLNEEEAFELPPVWHMGAICSLTLLDEEKRGICMDKWVPEPDKEPSYDVLRVIERTGLPVHAQLYERMLMVWRYNSFGHHSEQPGLVLYNRISMMAHSCSASACWHYGEADAFILRARVKLNAGDELTISYIGDEDLFKSSDVRREKVNGWLFTCCCPRCSLPVDNARGFRCSACATGTMFFKTEDDGTTSSSPCTVCKSVPSEEIINYYLEFEQAYVDRLSETDKNDLADAKLVYVQAQRVFNQHWVLYQLHTVLFEGHREGGDYETAAFHQMERIKYVSQVMPLASYTLAWLHEELGDTLMTKEEQEDKGETSDNKLNLMSRCFEDAFNLLYILCGKDHDYTVAADAKKTICDRRLQALSAAAEE